MNGKSAKSTVEPKIPQVKIDVFGNVPQEYCLQSKVESFYTKRLVDALHRLFHPPPDGISDRIFVTDRNDVSAQVRQRLATPASAIGDLVTMCVNIERMDAELRELDQNLKQMQQNTAAFKRGTELYEERGKLITRRDQVNKRLEEVAAEDYSLGDGVG